MYGEATSMNHEDPILNIPKCLKTINIKNDTIVESVMLKFKQRSELGIAKYGTTLDRDDLSILEWINHAQEELMDGILYLEKLKQKSTNSTN